MKKIFKIVFVVAIIFSITLFGKNMFNVEATNVSCKTKFGITDGQATNGSALGLKLKQTGTNTYNLIVKDTAGVKENDLTFKITKISPSNGDFPTEEFTTETQSLKIIGSDNSDPSVEAANYVKVYVTATSSKCTGTVDMVVSYGSSTQGDDVIDNSGTIKTEEEVEINKKNEDTSFDEKINYARDNATKSYIKKETNTNGIEELRGTLSLESKERSFKCNTNLQKKAKEIQFNFNDNLDDDDNYYLEENTKYLYAKATQEIDVGTYKYHYYNYKATEQSKITCKVTCEEGVVVKYGPPVASKAGLCFEYKVRVESRVRCEASSIKKPKKPGVCTPGSKCDAPDQSYTSAVGGPNDSFDACIKECDGGKYTEACSDKCYKKVYQTNSTSKNTSINETTNSNLRLLATTEESWATAARNYNSQHNNVDGYYIKEGSSIHWYPSGTMSLWHRNHSWGITGHVYNVIKDGIPRTSVCNDNCYWKTSCLDNNQYLNKGNQEQDYIDNTEIYEQAKEKCESYNSCSTTTATFNISVNYKKEGQTTSEKIVYPYSTKEDKLNSFNAYSNVGTNKKLCTLETDKSKPANESTYNNKNTTLNSALITNSKYAQCYGKSCPPNHYYLSEWSFPGSYINKKTGEISYNSKYSANDAWRNKNLKFCIPRDALSVNSLWYQWYLHQVEGLSAENDNECLTEQESKIIKQSKFTDESKIDEWNINAQTNKFGFFHWNIKMSCFYATPASKNKEDTTCGEDERTRTVDNTEIIPTTRSKDSKGNTKTGFNWTGKAQLTNKMVQEAGNDYIVNPETVRTSIQTKGDSIYTNEQYVDYEFELTKETLKNIKEYNSIINLGEYCGSIGTLETFGYLDKTNNETISISHYQSNIFRGEDEVTYSCKKEASLKITAKTKPESTLKCNNISLNKSGCGQD